MTSKRTLLGVASLGALIGLAASPGAPAASASDAVTQQEIQALKDQINELQRRLDAQSAAQAQTKATADAAAAQAASAKAAAAAVSSQVQSEVTTAVAAAKQSESTDKLHYKGVTITLGGFTALESVYRTRDINSDIASNFNAITYPVGGAPSGTGAISSTALYGNTSEFKFSARQSRFSMLAQGQPNADTLLSAYGEFDFLGAAQTANSNESDSYTPRVRNLYNTVDWNNQGLHLLFGQNWSLVTLNSQGITPRNELMPATIDAQYVPGFDWARQPQVRVTQDLDDKQLWLALSVENPQTTFYTNPNTPTFPKGVNVTYNAPAGSGYNSANTLSLNHMPDVVAKVAFEPRIADRTVHFEAYYLYRDFYERLNGENIDKSGGGFGAGLTVPVIPKLLDFQVSGLGGKGIGRYGSAQLPDVTFDYAGNLHPISEIMALAGLTLHATPVLDLYLYAGEEKESSAAYDLTNKGVTTPYGYGNLLYSNSGCLYEGAKGACVGNTNYVEQGTAGFWYRPYVGNFGRYQWGLQYSYTERKAFWGVGGQPTGNDGMVFASFRYYPF